MTGGGIPPPGPLQRASDRRPSGGAPPRGQRPATLHLHSRQQRVVYIARVHPSLQHGGPGRGRAPAGPSLASQPSRNISADGAWLLLNSEHLYSVPLAGGPPILLAEGPQLTTFTHQPRFLVRCSTWPTGIPIHRKDSTTYPSPEGGPPFCRRPPPVSEGPSRGLSVTADSSRVVYVDQDLFSVPIAGGTAIRISHPLAGFDIVREFQLTPDGRTARLPGGEYYPCHTGEYFHVPVVGGTPIRLNGPLAARRPHPGRSLPHRRRPARGLPRRSGYAGDTGLLRCRPGRRLLGGRPVSVATIPPGAASTTTTARRRPAPRPIPP